MAKEISAKGPYARKFSETVREIDTLLDVIHGQIKGGATTIIGGLPATTETSLRAVMKELWVWVKDYTILENEVIDLREQIANLKQQIHAKEEGPGPITSKEAGPWFDSSRGIYIPAMVIAEAIARGWKGAPECRDLTYEEISNLDDYLEISEEAESWFNERAPAGYSFGTHPDHGDWGLWEIEED